MTKRCLYDSQLIVLYVAGRMTSKYNIVSIMPNTTPSVENVMEALAQFLASLSFPLSLDLSLAHKARMKAVRPNTQPLIPQHQNTVQENSMCVP